MTVQRARVARPNEYPPLELDVLAVRIRVRRRVRRRIAKKKKPKARPYYQMSLSFPNVTKVLSNDNKIRQRDPKYLNRQVSLLISK